MKKRMLAIAALLLCAGVAGAVNVIRMIPLYGGPPPVPPVFTFGLVTNSAGTAPTITAAGLTGYTDVVWTDPDGQTTNSKTPNAAFFRKQGQYSIACSDWTKVTAYSFGQSTKGSFLSSINHTSVTAVMPLTTLQNSFINNSNNVSYSLGVLPTNITSLYGTWRECNDQTSSLPEVNHLVNVTSLVDAWFGCWRQMNFPEVNNLVKVTSLAGTWRACYDATNFPAVSNLLSVSTIGTAWYQNRGIVNGAYLPYVNCLTNVQGTGLDSTWTATYVQYGFPEVSNLTKVTSLSGTWGSSVAYTGDFPYVNSLTNVTTLATTWRENAVRVNGFPEVSNLTKVTTLGQTWFNLSAVTAAFPDIVALTNVTTMGSTYSGAKKCPFFPLPDNSKQLLCTDYNETFANCNVMTNTIAGWTWRTNINDFDSYRSKIWYTNVPGPLATNIKATGFTMRMDSSGMPADHVGQVLIDLDTSGASNGTVNVGGASGSDYTSNMPPTAAGYIAVTNLRAKGWTVTVN